MDIFFGQRGTLRLTTDPVHVKKSGPFICEEKNRNKYQWLWTPQALLLVQIIFTQSQSNPKFCIAMVIFDVNATFQRSPGAIFVPETAPTAIWNI